VVAAAEAGKHVLSDKPLATTVADAERAVAACEAAGVRLGVTFQTRNHEGMRDVRDLLAEGGIGSVRLVQVELGTGRKLPQNWRTDPGLAGVGVMHNLGVHAYDLLRFLLGSEVVEATAVVDVEPGFSVDTLALALLRFDNGALAYVNANQSVPNPRQDLSVHGTEGAVFGRDVTRPNLTGSISVIGRDGSSERTVSSAGAFVTTIGNFADAVLEGREPSPSGLDGLRSAELIDALTRSARERRSVRPRS
jgi:1,5-anhydro-D-fructose reductase (1,5-anhydro-D-mannitol-forming)